MLSCEFRHPCLLTSIYKVWQLNTHFFPLGEVRLFFLLLYSASEGLSEKSLQSVQLSRLHLFAHLSACIIALFLSILCAALAPLADGVL